MSEMPHSLAMISAIFKEFNYDVKVIENTFKKQLANDDFLKEVKRYKPDVVGISMLTMQVLNVYKLAREIKRQFKHIIVIAGGTHVTTCDVEAIEQGFNLVVRNEGEETLRELLSEKPLDEVLGITYRDLRQKKLRETTTDRG